MERGVNNLEGYFRSGNDVPVSKVTIPWPDVGMVTINLTKCTIEPKEQQLDSHRTTTKSIAA